jgi:hypothetical protein
MLYFTISLLNGNGPVILPEEGLQILAQLDRFPENEPASLLSGLLVNEEK